MAMVDGFYIPDRAAAPGYLMRGHKKGTTLEIGGRSYKVKIYDAGQRFGDRYTVCVDGGELWYRMMFAAGENGIWSYEGELYIERFPGPHLGRVVAWDDMSESFKRSVIWRLTPDED